LDAVLLSVYVLKSAEVLVGTAFTIVVNPAADGGKAPHCLQAIRTVLDAAGVHYLTRYSKSLQDAGVLAAEAAAGGNHVVAVGGDGMAAAIAGAVAQAKPEGDGVVAIIPAGRGNDLARTYGIPFASTEAAKLLLRGRHHPMDLIEVAGADGTRVAVAGSIYIGITSMAGQIANNFRLIGGPLVYPLSALYALAGWKPATFTVDSAGPALSASALSTPQEFLGYGVVVANIPYFGAGMKVAPSASPNDGLLDAVLMRHAPKPTFLRALRMIRNGSYVKLHQINTGCATSLTVTCDRSMPVGADGESLSLPLPVSIRIAPHALRIIAGRGPSPVGRK
jgi:diacylglycerol kinase (ATP)